MIAPLSLTPITTRTVLVDRYLSGWAIGTGLRISIPPGRYDVVRESIVGEREFFELNNGSRVEATQFGRNGAGCEQVQAS